MLQVEVRSQQPCTSVSTLSACVRLLIEACADCALLPSL